MRHAHSSRRGAALMYAMLVVLVVSSSAAALQARTASVIRGARLDRERVQVRLDAESSLESCRALYARGTPLASVKFGVDGSADLPALETRPDGTLCWSTRSPLWRSRSGASIRLEVTLAPAGGRLPRIVRWTE